MASVLHEFLRDLPPKDIQALVYGFAQFGFALRPTTHHGVGATEAGCIHVVRSAIDQRKNLFIWDGEHHDTRVAALRSIIEYAKGTKLWAERRLVHRQRDRSVRKLVQPLEDRIRSHGPGPRTL
jgi:hypothetical protein